MMEKEVWLNNVKQELEIFADHQFQTRVWGGIRAEGWEVYSSWAEHMCRLFDDADFEGFLGEYWPQFGLSEVLHKKLFHLRDCLDAYNRDESLTDVQIVQDPEWIKITKVAKDVLEAFRQEIDAS